MTRNPPASPPMSGSQPDSRDGVAEIPPVTDSSDAPDVRDTRARVLAAAADSFRQLGYTATSTRMLAAKVGMQSASLYHYISTKEDLLFAICDESLSRITAAVQLAAAPADSEIIVLRRVIAAHVATALRDRDLHATMLIEMRALSHDRRGIISKERAAYRSVLTGFVEAAQQAGELRDDRPASHLTLALLNLLNWSIFWFRADGEFSVDEVADLLSTMFFDGALKRPPPVDGVDRSVVPAKNTRPRR